MGQFGLKERHNKRVEESLGCHGEFLALQHLAFGAAIEKLLVFRKNPNLQILTAWV